MSDQREQRRAANAAALAAASRARPIVESGRAVRLGRRQLSWIALLASLAVALAAGWSLARRGDSGHIAAEDPGATRAAPPEDVGEPFLRGRLKPVVEKP